MSSIANPVSKLIPSVVVGGIPIMGHPLEGLSSDGGGAAAALEPYFCAAREREGDSCMHWTWTTSNGGQLALRQPGRTQELPPATRGHYRLSQTD